MAEDYSAVFETVMTVIEVSQWLQRKGFSLDVQEAFEGDKQSNFSPWYRPISSR